MLITIQATGSTAANTSLQAVQRAVIKALNEQGVRIGSASQVKVEGKLS